MANGMASLGIVEVSRPTITTATTNERGENLDELPPDKTRRGNQKEGNEVRADPKPYSNNENQDDKEKGEGNNEVSKAEGQLEEGESTLN